MTAVDQLYDAVASNRVPAPTGRFKALRSIWTAFRRRRAERKLVIMLSRLDKRLLRDIGIEPQDVYEGLNGRPGPSVLFNPMRRVDHE